MVTTTWDRQWYEDQRRICADFIAAADAEFVMLWAREQRPLLQEESEQLRERSELIRVRLQSLALIRLECPPEVVVVAEGMRKGIFALHEAQLDPELRLRERSDYDAARRSFITVAKAHLRGMRP